MKNVFLMMTLFLGGLLVSCSNEGLEAPAPRGIGEVVAEKQLESQTLNLVNDFRSSRNLGILKYNEKAYDLAFEHAAYMAGAGKLTHDNFQQRAEQLAAEVNAVLVGENLSRNYPDPVETLKGWLESPDHFSTIVGDYTHTAVAVVSTKDGQVYYAQLFFKTAGE